MAQKFNQSGKTNIPGQTPRSAASGHRAYADEASGDEQWFDSPLTDKKLVKGPLLSGDYKQPKFVDYSGGNSAKYTEANRKGLQFQDADGLPAKKGSRENDWRGDK